MILQCEDGFLFHVWGSTGKCVRCGVTGASDLFSDPAFHRSHHPAHLDQGTPCAETSVDALSEPALLSRAHLADHPSLFEVLLPAFLRRHHRA